MICDVTVDSSIASRSFVFSQSYVQIYASLTNIRRGAVYITILNAATAIPLILVRRMDDWLAH